MQHRLADAGQSDTPTQRRDLPTRRCDEPRMRLSIESLHFHPSSVCPAAAAMGQELLGSGECRALFPQSASYLLGGNSRGGMGDLILGIVYEGLKAKLGKGGARM